MPDHTYKIIDLVGSSSESIEDAINGALGRASETISHLDWFQVKEIRGTVSDGHVGWYQVTLGVGFQVLKPGDVHREA
ncbi:MAG: dodecin domain-containing protein [Chloroflexi bacterium]|nr:dodecin domain-containing protein [Chloroflexota bacterium]